MFPTIFSKDEEPGDGNSELDPYKVEDIPHIIREVKALHSSLADVCAEIMNPQAEQRITAEEALTRSCFMEVEKIESSSSLSRITNALTAGGDNPKRYQ